MTAAHLIDLDEVRHALTARAVLDHYQLRTRRSGPAELESSACPRRADHSRRAFTINLRTGQWQCFPCGIGGDPLRLVAEFEHLSDRTDFAAVLARAAQIAGVAPSDLPEAERARRREQIARERAAREAAATRERAAREAAAVPRATRYWDTKLDLHNQQGEAYLEARGVHAAVDRGLVRFDPRRGGSPTIPLHTRDGRIRNVVRRQLPELGEPKAAGLWACPTAGTLVGALLQVTDDVVLTEGVFDSLTAALAWPAATVLGAHGAGNLEAIARAAAPLIVQHRGRLRIVPHDDQAGRDAATAAARAAVEAGLSLRQGSLVIVHCGEKDLNDAWRRGWRPA